MNGDASERGDYGCRLTMVRWPTTTTGTSASTGEMLAFSHPDVREGVHAIREKRPPQFPSAI
jgi:hypothetical protein